MYACFISLSLFNENRKLSVIVLIFVSNRFQSFDIVGKFISFHSYWSMKGLNFAILCRIFPIHVWFSVTVTTY